MQIFFVLTETINLAPCILSAMMKVANHIQYIMFKFIAHCLESQNCFMIILLAVLFGFEDPYFKWSPTFIAKLPFAYSFSPIQFLFSPYEI